MRHAYSASSYVNLDLIDLHLEQYDSFLICIEGKYGYGGTVLAVCTTDDGTITKRTFITRESGYSDFSLTDYRYFRMFNSAGGKINTYSILIIKMG